ncbi:uncharacterized protein BO96DRAFT_412550 [Aspergillus niger CBS 101883]|uniref:uncharacterized protein n=1 Tax=Aspergillus lacticoffeatus (strain CBS 101883) TaxID=1450533 RepID=UPI000D805C30|nr:uncharacterized protein BO96DRAFT_412550 [Aspergillus niger CBS 101883]PYH56396.1 hypothetical protein BO96DRAFT_412550 [Aspergillus niger CBS 101883]
MTPRDELHGYLTLFSLSCCILHTHLCLNQALCMTSYTARSPNHGMARSGVSSLRPHGLVRIAWNPPRQSDRAATVSQPQTNCEGEYLSEMKPG